MAVALIAVMVFSLFSCGGTSQKMERYNASFTGAFDTFTNLTGYAESEEVFTEYAQYLYDELLNYHKLFDIYNNYKGINNVKSINDNAGKEAVKVDKKLIDMLSFGTLAYEKTDGYVNIAMGSVLRLWHEEREVAISNPEKTALPNMNELEDAKTHTKIEDVIIDEAKQTVFLKDIEMSLDVGAVAKGYAIEKIARELEAKGFTSGIINVGGNVRIIGSPTESSKEFWTVGIQDPDNAHNNESIIEVLNMKKGSLATSGDYQRYYIVDSKEYNHIISPKTLMPSDYYKSVSIICDDTAISDMLSTYIFMIDYDSALAVINNFENVEIYCVLKDGKIHYTDGLKSMMQ